MTAGEIQMTQRADGNASGEQIKALQTLYGQWRGHSLQERGDPRVARLAWASERTGREISSFSYLTCDEARLLIDLLKGSMGKPIGDHPQPWRRVDSRERAQAAGTSGRRECGPSFIQMASADDLARVDELVRRLEWTPEQFNRNYILNSLTGGKRGEYALRKRARGEKR